MGGQWRKENPNPRVHRSGGKLGEPRFPLERVDPRVGIFLSPLTTHDGFYLSHSPTLTKFMEKFTQAIAKANLSHVSGSEILFVLRLNVPVKFFKGSEMNFQSESNVSFFTEWKGI